MQTTQSKLLKAREAAELLCISLPTLAEIERRGDIVPYRTPGGHRRYSQEMLDAYLERSTRRSGEKA